MEHRLAAVLAADMVGYSRLMEADEEARLRACATHSIEVVDPAIAKNSGRIIKTTGDGMLVEFASVSDAVLCAMEIQQRMQRRNRDVPEDRRIEFRIGINLGDIIFDRMATSTATASTSPRGWSRLPTSAASASRMRCTNRSSSVSTSSSRTSARSR